MIRISIKQKYESLLNHKLSPKISHQAIIFQKYNNLIHIQMQSKAYLLEEGL